MCILDSHKLKSIYIPRGLIPYLFDKAPWALIKFLDLENGDWALIRGGRLLNFHHFLQVGKFILFNNKT